MKRLALQNKRFGVLRMAFPARNVLGTLEQQALAVFRDNCTIAPAEDWSGQSK